MESGKIIDKVTESEISSLSAMYALLEQSKKSLMADNGESFAVSQGALTAVYNGLGRLVNSKDSKQLNSARIRELEGWGEHVFQIREKIVNGVLKDSHELKTVVNDNNLCVELGFVMATLQEYARSWYGADISSP